jgi:hypothetical protein
VPASIKDIVGNVNFELYFVVQPKDFGNLNGNVLFRPHYLFIPHPISDKEGILPNQDYGVNPNIAFFMPNANFIPANQLDTLFKNGNLTIHDNRISDSTGPVINTLNTPASVWSLVDDANGEGVKYHITLHWILSNSLYELFLNLGRSFKDLITELPLKNEFDSLTQSLTGLLQ